MSVPEGFDFTEFKEDRPAKMDVRSNFFVSGAKLQPSLTVELLHANLKRPDGHHRTEENSCILRDVTCAFNPGTLTLVLGPPGSGKTSLLRLGAGFFAPQTPSKDASTRAQSVRNWIKPEPALTGSLTYNGESANTLSSSFLRDVIGFLPQRDLLLPTLTVKETIKFALDMKGPYFAPEAFSNGTERQAESILQSLCIQKCADTRIGDATSRGVSGGEQKRVALAETLAGGYSTLFLDEYSTGLDSSVTLDITRALRDLAKTSNVTVVAALLQPPPEVFDLFDNIIVLSDGAIIYNGPKEGILHYFDNLGYQCPPNVDVADFLQIVASPGNNQVFLRQDNRQAEVTVPPPVTSREFGLAFARSALGRQLVADAENKLDTPQDPSSMQLPLPMAKFHPWYKHFFLILQREFRVIYRDQTVIVARLLQALVMGLLLGSLFYQIAPDQFQTRMNFLWYILTFFPGVSLLHIPVAMEFRALFYRQQRVKRFFPAWMYALSAKIAQIPLEFLESSIFTCAVYFLAGLSTSSPGTFFYTLLILFLMTVSVNQLMAAVVAFSPSAAIAQAIGVLCILILMTFGGFAVAEKLIPVGWLWAYWSSPVSYGFRALTQNEFLRSGDEYGRPGVDGNGFKSTGQIYLDTYGVRSTRGSFWQWIDVVALLGFFLVYLFITIIGLSFVSFDDIGRKSTKAGTTETRQQPDAIQSTLENEAEARIEEADLEAGTLQECYLTSPPATLSWHSLSYSVPLATNSKGLFYLFSSCSSKQSSSTTSRTLLNCVDGMAMPGRMLALMGASGAGKTTLLDVLAGRKNVGSISGDICVNRERVDTKSQRFRSISGYVEQFDRLSELSTVWESLVFSASLRYPDLNGNERAEHLKVVVANVLDILDLREVEQTLSKELSLSQRKKLSVGIELVANPSILFLDEPTSGLDSREALNVIRALKRVSDGGGNDIRSPRKWKKTTVICTVHQPSSLLFAQFDDLLLLSHGEVVYFGELSSPGVKMNAGVVQDSSRYHSRGLVTYLESISSTLPYQPGQNPASWMLEVISAAAPQLEVPGKTFPSQNGVDSFYQLQEGTQDTVSHKESENNRPNYVTEYKISGLYAENRRVLSEILEATTVTEQSAEQMWREEDKNETSSSYKMSIGVQIWLLLKRLTLTSVLRNPDTVLSKIFTFAFVCLVMGTTYASNYRYDELSTTTQLVGLMASFYFVGVACWVLSCLADMVVIDQERQIFDKERSANYYSVVSYAAAWSIVTIPMNILYATVFSNALYWLIGYNSSTSAFLWFYLLVFLVMLAGNAAGMLMVAMAPNLKVANLLGGLVFSIVELFGGILISVKNMPDAWAWVYWLVPVHYFLEGIVVTQFNNDQRSISTPSASSVTPTFAVDTTNLSTTETSTFTIQEFIDFYFSGSYNYNHLTLDLIVLSSAALIFLLLFALALKHVNHFSR